MKLQTAFKLSALAVALGTSTISMADTTIKGQCSPIGNTEKTATTNSAGNHNHSFYDNYGTWGADDNTSSNGSHTHSFEYDLYQNDCMVSGTQSETKAGTIVLDGQTTKTTNDLEVAGESRLGKTVIGQAPATFAAGQEEEEQPELTVHGDTLIDGILTAENIKSKNIDLGSSELLDQFLADDPDTVNKPVQLRKAADETEYYEIFDGLGNNADNDKTKASTYIRQGNETDGFTLATYTGSTEGSTFVNGGTASNYKNGKTTDTTVTKELNDQNLTYGESVTSTPSINADFAVTDANGTTIETPDVNLETNQYTEKSKSSVSGIIGTKPAEGENPAENIYGFEASSKDATYQKEDGAEDKLVSGNESKATLVSDELALTSTTTTTDETTGEVTTTVSSTTVTANGLTTTGTVDAQKITLGGKDLQGTLNDVTKSVTGLNQKLENEVSRLDGRIDEELRLNAEASTTYTDALRDELAEKVTTSELEVNGDASVTGTLTAAAITLGDKDLQTTLNDETQARSEADTALENSISTNTVDIAKNTTAIADLNTRANQLNKRVDEVEKTAYRGVAIALAAQQNVPNIKPGQFAVFGGVGHYESESAFAMGVVGSINERTSISGAIGVAGGSEVGGRVGVAYVFGGK